MKKLLLLLALLPSMIFATTIRTVEINEDARVEISSPSYPPAMNPPSIPHTNAAVLFLDLKAGISNVYIRYGVRMNPGCFWSDEKGQVVYSTKSQRFSIIPLEEKPIASEFLKSGEDGFNISEEGKYLPHLREPIGMPVCMAIGEHSRVSKTSFTLQKDATVKIFLGKVSEYGNFRVEIK